MNWTRSETLTLALHSCARCQGLGLRAGRHARQVTCNCVLRGIFRVCYDRFCYCSSKEKYISRASLELGAGGETRYLWGRRDEEYCADFVLVSRRTLDENEYRIFKYHYLLGADWRLCCRKLNMDRGNFFHAVYRIQQKLGETFRSLKPYPLYPLEEYFGTSLHRVVPASARPRQPSHVGPIPARLRFPRPLAA